MPTIADKVEYALRTELPTSQEWMKCPWIAICNHLTGKRNYSLAAIHTTTLTTTNFLYDLVARLEYFETLRNKVGTV
jgi:hypothetical protein